MKNNPKHDSKAVIPLAWTRSGARRYPALAVAQMEQGGTHMQAEPPRVDLVDPERDDGDVLVQLVMRVQLLINVIVSNERIRVCARPRLSRGPRAIVSKDASGRSPGGAACYERRVHTCVGALRRALAGRVSYVRPGDLGMDACCRV
jgi:hypothetical protein